MAQASNQVVIRRPAGEVYQFLADGLNNPKWRDAVTDIALRSGEGGRVGAVYGQSMRGPGGRKVAGDYRITEATPNATIRFEVVAGPARPVGLFELSEVAEGTQVRFSLSLAPKGLMKLMDGMIAKTMQGEVASLARVKALLEAA